jgi:nucleosome binding factor SPN SPT16 subunit
MLVKDRQELEKVRKAGKLCSTLESRLLKDIEDIIEDEQSRDHSAVAKKIEEILENETEIKRLEKKFNIDMGCADFPQKPLIQSGGIYNFASETSD